MPRVEGMIMPHLAPLTGARDAQLIELRRRAKKGPSKHVCIASFFGVINGETVGAIYNHLIIPPPPGIVMGGLVGLITHNQHTFVGVNYLSDRIVIFGYVPVGDKQAYAIAEIMHEDYQSGVYWYHLTSLNREDHPNWRQYQRELRAVNIMPVEQNRIDPEVKRITMDTVLARDNGVIYVNKHNNSSVMNTGATGNVFLKNYKEKDGKIQFMFSFYGTAEGEYVAFDETPRGSLEPNYKMLASGYGSVKDDGVRELFFHFTHKKQLYVFRYCITDDKKPVLGRAYHVSTNDKKTGKLLLLAPEEMNLVKKEGSTDVGGVPIFYVSFGGKKVEASISNDIQEDEEMRPKIKSKIQTINAEDAERFFKPQTHIKERPDPVDPDFGLVSRKRVFETSVKHINALQAKNVEVIIEDKILRVNIIHDDGGSIVFRIKTAKTELALYYLSEDDNGEPKWVMVKKFSAADQGKAVGRLLKMVKNNLVPDEEED